MEQEDSSAASSSRDLGLWAWARSARRSRVAQLPGMRVIAQDPYVTEQQAAAVK